MAIATYFVAVRQWKTLAKLNRVVAVDYLDPLHYAGIAETSALRRMKCK